MQGLFHTHTHTLRTTQKPSHTLFAYSYPRALNPPAHAARFFLALFFLFLVVFLFSLEAVVGFTLFRAGSHAGLGPLLGFVTGSVEGSG